MPERDFAWYWLWRSCLLNSNGSLGRCPGYAAIAELGTLDEDHPLLDTYNLGSRSARRLFRPEPSPDGDGPMPCNTCVFFGRHHGSTTVADTPESLLLAEASPADALVTLGVPAPATAE